MRAILIAAICVAVFMMGRTAAAAELDYKTVIHAYLKLNKYADPETTTDDYMRCFRAPVWNKYRNDEFELKSRRAETADVMKKAIADFDLAVPVTIGTEVQFGEYDFTAGKFALHPFSDGTYFPVDSGCSTGGLPHRVDVFITNPDILDGLPMSQDKAKDFIAKRKSGGFVNRSVRVELSVRFVDLKGDNALSAEIEKVVVIDDSPARLGAIATVTK